MIKFQNRKGGFTLIELMIVVAIIGILAAIAIPNFIRFQLKSKSWSSLAQTQPMSLVWDLATSLAMGLAVGLAMGLTSLAMVLAPADRCKHMPANAHIHRIWQHMAAYASIRERMPACASIC